MLSSFRLTIKLLNLLRRRLGLSFKISNAKLIYLRIIFKCSLLVYQKLTFVNCCQFMYLVISLLVLRAGCGIWLYQFLIIAYRFTLYMDRVKRIWYLSPMRAAKVQASLRIRAVSPEPSLLAHTSSESRGTFRQKTRSLAPLNGWTCAVEICHDGMLEDTNSLDGAHINIMN